MKTEEEIIKRLETIRSLYYDSVNTKHEKIKYGTEARVLEWVLE